MLDSSVMLNECYSECCSPFSTENARPTDKDDLRSELATMRGMEPHPNILNFLGMCSETGRSVRQLIEIIGVGLANQLLSVLTSKALDTPSLLRRL